MVEVLSSKLFGSPKFHLYSVKPFDWIVLLVNVIISPSHPPALLQSTTGVTGTYTQRPKTESHPVFKSFTLNPTKTVESTRLTGGLNFKLLFLVGSENVKPEVTGFPPEVKSTGVNVQLVP